MDLQEVRLRIQTLNGTVASLGMELADRSSWDSVRDEYLFQELQDLHQQLEEIRSSLMLEWCTKEEADKIMKEA